MDGEIILEKCSMLAFQKDVRDVRWGFDKLVNAAVIIAVGKRKIPSIQSVRKAEARIRPLFRIYLSIRLKSAPSCSHQRHNDKHSTGCSENPMIARWYNLQCQNFEDDNFFRDSVLSGWCFQQSHSQQSVTQSRKKTQHMIAMMSMLSTFVVRSIYRPNRSA